MTTVELPQHMQALAEGNRIRLARAGEKRRLKTTGSRRDALVEAVSLISSPPQHLLGMRLAELLASCHRMGATSAARLLRDPVLNPRRQAVTIGDLTPAEKRRVLDAVWHAVQVARR